MLSRLLSRRLVRSSLPLSPSLSPSPTFFSTASVAAFEARRLGDALPADHPTAPTSLSHTLSLSEAALKAGKTTEAASFLERAEEGVRALEAKKGAAADVAPLVRLALETQRAFLCLAQVRELERGWEAEDAAAVADGSREGESEADAASRTASRSTALSAALATLSTATSSLSSATKAVEASSSAAADVVQISWENVAYVKARGGVSEEEREAERSAALALFAESLGRSTAAASPLRNGTSLSGTESEAEAEVDTALLTRLRSAVKGGEEGVADKKRLPLDPPGVVLPKSFVSAWREGTSAEK
jgi:hypothetical protein